MSDPSTPSEDTYFNDLSRNPSHRSVRSVRSISPQDGSVRADGGEAGGSTRPKRIACIICRKRKLRCDGEKPSCGTCARLGHNCAYDEVRRKSGPKRGYVKELEARLAQVETQLKSKTATSRQSSTSQHSRPMSRPTFPLGVGNLGDGVEGQDRTVGFSSTHHNLGNTLGQAMPSVTVTRDDNHAPQGEFPWEMMGLGLEEPLPPQDLMDELHQIYFEMVHPSVPMVHKYRYLAAMNLAPHMRPAICLRYAMWALACSVTEKYLGYAEIFYQRARKYAETDEMKSHGEAFITVGHAQCWTLIATYEFKVMYFPRAWMSCGRATRLAQMLGLTRVDGTGLEVKVTLPSPRDWTDREERRRTFWMAYCNDRYASIGTGWPMQIDERDIMTNLPSTNEAYERSQAQDTITLTDAMTGDGASSLSSFAGIVVVASLFGRSLTHLHRSGDSDRPDDPVNGEFWKRHHKLDKILTNTLMFLPDQLRVPTGNKDPHVIFLNTNLHASAICLHQAAILKAEKHKLSVEMVKQSTDRCFAAAEEIVSIMRLTSHLHVATSHPFLSFCLYVGARVFTHAYKKRPNDEGLRRNLDFLLNAMQAHRRKNPLTESFLIQLTVDLEAAGLEGPRDYTRQSYSLTKTAADLLVQSKQCPPVFQSFSETQPSYHEMRSGASSRRSSLPGMNRGDKSTSPSAQYSASRFTVPTRERRTHIDSIRSVGGPGSQMQDVIMDNGWGGMQSNDPHNDAAVDPYHHIFDADMSSEDASDPIGLSGPTTTSNSHGASSHTSYSPSAQDVDTLEGSHGTADRPIPGGQPPYYQTSHYPAYTSSSEYVSHSSTSNDFAIPSAWELGTGPIPTSVPEQGWAQVFDGMAWSDGNAIGDAIEGWRPGPGPGPAHSLTR